MSIILLAGIPIFFIIALGALLRVLKVADDQWVTVLNKFELYLGLPALVLANVLNVSDTGAVTSEVIAINVVLLSAIIAGIYIIGAIFHVEKSLRNTYCICIFFGNIAYLGLPFVTALLPGSGGSVAIHIVIYVLILFTLGIAILEWSQRTMDSLGKILLKVITSPLVITSLIGILVLAFRLEAPEVIHKSISLLAGSASPIALLSLGIFIGHKIHWDMSMLHATAISFAKLLLVPLVFLGASYIFNIRGGFSVSILEAAMPLAVTPFALSQVYNLNRHVISNAVLISTILSMVTLPLFGYLALS